MCFDQLKGFPLESTKGMGASCFVAQVQNVESGLYVLRSRRPRLIPQSDRSVFQFQQERDRKSTRLNSSHGYISYAVFCLKKKKICTISLQLERHVKVYSGE